ncbi:hypothetical protein [Streptomyces violens]|uniref:hypothetical protein n=1 Tax=Streptomyces violens TaxID=66377 RepID=UPI000997F63D|nr:hypothetical protein [Streptomyces violens]
MQLNLNPPTGVGPLCFGMAIADAAEVASAWGEVRVGQPAQGSTAFKVLIVHPDFEVVLLADDGETLTGVETWRFENEEADVQVEFDGMDVFRTPAHDLIQRISEAGHEADTSDDEVTVYPGLALLLSRETSREAPLDPHDGHPRYVHYALAAPSEYFD